MNGIKILTLLEGVPELIRRIELTDAATRVGTVAAIQRGTKRIAADARQRAPKVTGEMASTIRDEYSKDGLTGYVKAGFGKLPRRSRAAAAARQNRLASRRSAKGTKAGKGSYAPVVERGDPKRHHKPHPFVMPAFVAAQPGIKEDLARATVIGAKEGGFA